MQPQFLVVVEGPSQPNPLTQGAQLKIMEGLDVKMPDFELDRALLDGSCAQIGGGSMKDCGEASRGG